MKRACDLTDGELLALDGPTIERLIDYECALDGVPLLPAEPGLEPVSAATVPDVTTYKVGQCGYLFLTSEDARKVLDVLEAVALYDDEGYGDERHLKRLHPGSYYFPEIKSEKFLSAEKFAAVRSALADHKLSHAAWERAKKEYDEAAKKREAVRDRVVTLVDDARERHQWEASVRSLFARYLDLAGGDATTAMRFLLNARSDIGGDLGRNLIQELCPGYGVEEAPPTGCSRGGGMP